ncbi:MAG: TlyA family rRNA (cytidine-2'-O)-methyltransferase [Clostridia bacterium]|nr:MAG: TlyA family rRNA (cytidine-2'-O)-methyltransferase [Clostridia bacterium]
MNPKPSKERLDKLLAARGLAESSEQARRLIMAGLVLVNDRPATKSGHKISIDAEIRIKERSQYVSRGGYKLVAALDAFGVSPADWVCADLGASTGGFTDVLLQRGASRVYAVDVGYGQLHWRLRTDPRVVVMERTNARLLDQLPELVHLVVVDASFISLRALLPAARRLLNANGQIIALIKPQFEADRADVGQGGVVRDASVHRQVLRDMVVWAAENAFSPQGLIPSPLFGPKGNREFLLWLKPNAPHSDAEDLVAMTMALVELSKAENKKA